MKKIFVWLMVVVMMLSLSSMACDAMSGNDSGDTDTDSGDTDTDSGDTDSGDTDSGDSSADMVRGIPVTADASEVIDAETAGTVAVTYKSDMSPADVADFYRTEMGNLGYTVSGDTEAAGNVAIVFAGELGTVSVGIAPDPLGSGKTVVSVGATP
jgi:hypothetical protein